MVSSQGNNQRRISQAKIEGKKGKEKSRQRKDSLTFQRKETGSKNE